MSEKIIRDPVHDVIAFRTDRPTDRLLFRLLNAAEFQRLRRIRQLGMASLAYPGADHSRYSHSLGVMQTARRIIEQLRGSFAVRTDPTHTRSEVHDHVGPGFLEERLDIAGSCEIELLGAVAIASASDTFTLEVFVGDALDRCIDHLLDGANAGGSAQR